MSADPPTRRTRTVPRRAGVIPPIIKLLSCGWHPRATRGTSLASTLLTASFAMFSVFAVPLLILPSHRSRSLPPPSYLSGSRRSSLIVRQDEDVRTRPRDALERAIWYRSSDVFLSNLERSFSLSEERRARDASEMLTISESRLFLSIEKKTAEFFTSGAPSNS